MPLIKITRAPQRTNSAPGGRPKFRELWTIHTPLSGITMRSAWTFTYTCANEFTVWWLSSFRIQRMEHVFHQWLLVASNKRKKTQNRVSRSDKYVSYYQPVNMKFSTESVPSIPQLKDCNKLLLSFWDSWANVNYEQKYFKIISSSSISLYALNNDSKNFITLCRLAGRALRVFISWRHFS
jgi:hypothetical protein